MSHAATKPVVRILLMDDHHLFSSALQARLEQDRRFEIVGVASSGTDAVRLANEAAPDVVLLDAAMADMDAATATRAIAGHEQAPQVLILAGTDSELEAVEAHDAHVTAYLRKPRSTADLLETIELATILIGAAVRGASPETPTG